MEARCCRTLSAIALLLVLGTGANYRTPNFVVTAADPQFAMQVGQAAEAYRSQLAIDWIGAELPPWNEPCNLVVKLHRDAFGSTTFAFDGPRGERGRPFGWEMEVNGTPERILDSVLPHEITHTILATRFGQRLPRWLDEGASSTCENVSETSKQHHNLIVFLTEGRGIPFNRMFRMMEYPRDERDMLALYAQGLSVVQFLLLQGERADFVHFSELGLSHGNWDAAIQEVYGFADLSDLQVTWNDWVKEGSPDFQNDSRWASRYVPSQRALAAANQNSTPRMADAPNGATSPRDQSPRAMPVVAASESSGSSTRTASFETPVSPDSLIGANLTDSFYYRRRAQGISAGTTQGVSTSNSMHPAMRVAPIPSSGSGAEGVRSDSQSVHPLPASAGSYLLR